MVSEGARPWGRGRSGDCDRAASGARFRDKLERRRKACLAQESDVTFALWKSIARMIESIWNDGGDCSYSFQGSLN